MQNNQELFKQAILDAQLVREGALAAAKNTLAEHFEPYIKEAMAQTLSEIDGEMEEMHTMRKHDGPTEHQKLSADVEESYLDEILSELDALSEEMENEDDTVDEGHIKADGYVDSAKRTKGNPHGSYSDKAKVSHGDHKLHEGEEGEDEGGNVDDDTESIDGSDEQEVVDITVGELKDIIRDVFMQLQGGVGQEEEPETFDADTDLSADLDSDGEEGGEEDDDEISLEEILAELENEEKMEEGASHGDIPGGEIDTQAKDVHQVEEVRRDLNEAVKTIKVLKAELNEMNLFNAKMLYVNKIFKSKNLNESQKTKVINAFDRAISVKEVENTYKTLLESIGEAPKKTSIKESVGFASKPIGSAPVRPIVEADAFVSRWQKLAGITN